MLKVLTSQMTKHLTSLALFFSVAVFAANDTTWLSQIDQDTRASLKAMEDPNTGLIWDNSRGPFDGGPKSVDSDFKVMPTNLALNLMLNLEEADQNPQKLSVIQKQIENIAKLAKYTDGDTELFFTIYKKSANAENADSTYQKSVDEVSSVDNMHLAVALWLTFTKYPTSEAGKTAKNIFDKMNFSKFIEADTGLLHGVLKPDPKTGKYVPADYTTKDWITQPRTKPKTKPMHGVLKFNPKAGDYTPANYTYKYWGSETRSIYALGYALNLFKLNPAGLNDFLEKSTQSVLMDCYQGNNTVGPILKTWDGGAFQLLLPELLYKESNLSKTSENSFKNYAELLRSEQTRRGLAFPPAASASQFSLDGTHGIPHYHSFSGTPAITIRPEWRRISAHESEWQDRVLTPHALFLAAIFDESNFKNELLDLKRYESSASGQKLYFLNVGYLDGLHLDGPTKDMVVPYQLSLDQGMIALSVSRMQSPDKHTLISRTLNADKDISFRLQNYYKRINPRLEEACAKTAEAEKKYH